jgi:hypothetical protein
MVLSLLLEEDTLKKFRNKKDASAIYGWK